MRRKILISIFIILAVIQFKRIDKSNPETDVSADFVASLVNAEPEISKLIRNACYDCHSNETTYPWYTDVAPISWWIKGHVDHGREELNFSRWNTYNQERKSHKMEECAEKVEEKDMPLKSYTWLHPPAKLTDAERDKLVQFFNSRK
jgi:hypothetical protein